MELIGIKDFSVLFFAPGIIRGAKFKREENKMILHICCAPCGGGCVERLKERQEKTVLFYSNSNLNSREEFERRLESVRRQAEDQQLELVVDPYDHESWLEAVRGFENEPEQGERCKRCFRFSLNRTALRAKEEAFCTTLTVSPRISTWALSPVLKTKSAPTNTIPSAPVTRV